VKESPVLIANEILLQKRKVNAANSGQDIVCQHTVQEHRVSNVWTCTSSVPYAVMMCTGTTKCYIYRTVGTLSWYILMCYFCDFLSLHSLGTSNVFVSSSPQNIVILQIMYVSLLFDTVLYCLTYQVLSCCNFDVTVTETDGQ